MCMRVFFCVIVIVCHVCHVTSCPWVQKRASDPLELEEHCHCQPLDVCLLEMQEVLSNMKPFYYPPIDIYIYIWVFKNIPDVYIPFEHLFLKNYCIMLEITSKNAIILNYKDFSLWIGDCDYLIWIHLLILLSIQLLNALRKWTVDKIRAPWKTTLFK